MASTRKREKSKEAPPQFATVEAYFDDLPDGWASFPRCVARASLLGGLRARGALDALEGLPARLRPLLSHLTAEAEWLPEVVHVAALLAIRDAPFGPRDDDAFLAWMGQLNRELLGGPELGGVIAIVTAAELVPRLPAMWELYHAGTPLMVDEHSATHARLVLAHPRRLFPPLSLESHRRTFALLLAKAGAQPSVTMRTAVSGEDARTLFEARWR
jgi:hypothetical protein